MSFQDALEPLVPTAVQLLADSLLADETLGRGRIAYLVRVLPLLNRDTRDMWRKEGFKIQVLLTYCAYLYNSGHRSRYLDGVLPMNEEDVWCWKEAAHPDIAPQTPRRAIELVDLFKSRACVAERHDAIRSEVTSSDVSLAARFMAIIVTTHLEFRLHPAYARHFTQCQRVGCTRPALQLPPEPESGGGEPSAGQYWKCCRDGRAPPPTSSLPSDMSFCCHGCYKATSSEFSRLVKFDIETPESSTRNGAAPTPSRLYRAAIQRNLGISRQVRTQKQVQTKHYPSTMANRERLMREQTIMLSVDLGLLYAASIIHEMPSRIRPDRPLPSSNDWRDHATCYFSAICRVRSIYLQYGQGKLSRGGGTELWLRRLHDQVLDIF